MSRKPTDTRKPSKKNIPHPRAGGDPDKTKKSADFFTKFIQDKRQELADKHTTFLRIKITPGAHKTEFNQLLETTPEPTLKLKVTATPTKNKANQTIIKFLADFFGASASIISGHTSPLKLIQLTHA